MLYYLTGLAVLRQGIKEGNPSTEQLMGLRLEGCGRLEETGGICQVSTERTFSQEASFLQ